MTILVTTQVNPTLDAFAASFAYAKLRQAVREEATFGIAGAPDAPTQWIIQELKINDVVHLEATTAIYDVFILLNAMMDGVAQLMPEIVNVNRVIEVIDRGSEEDEAHRRFPDAHLIVEPVGALSTIVTERFVARKLTIDSVSTQLLYSAIYTATDNLEPNRTTPRDRAALRELMTQMNIPITLVRDLFVATHAR